MEKKVLAVIAFRGFRDEEYAVPKQLLEKAGFRVVTVSTERGTATGKLGMTAAVDMLYTEAAAEDYAAVVFVGGPGSPGYWDDPAAHAFVRKMAAAGKVVAAICSACVTLAKAGVLQGRRATVWPGDGEVLRPLVGEYTAAVCERDGNFLTANGPAAAGRFGETLVGMLA